LIQEEIDRLYASIAEKTAAATVKIDEDRNQEISKQMDAIATTVAPAMQVNVPEAQGRQIDEYQRRGLSMSKNPGVVQDKVLSVQEQIRDILKSAKIQGKELVWS